MSIAVVEFCLFAERSVSTRGLLFVEIRAQNYDWSESWWNTLSIGRCRHLLGAVSAWGIVADAVAFERRSLEDVCSLRLMAGRRYVR